MKTKTLLSPATSIPVEIRWLLFLAAVKFLVHFLVNLNGGYGIFRDELYYLACADHPDTGYVDQPPFSIYVLGAWQFLFGDSLFAIRLVPALLGAGTVLMAGLIAREMQGGGRAQFLAGLAVLCMPILTGINSVFSMNSIDAVLWTISAYVVVRLINTQEPRYWLILGLLAGIGLMNKLSMGWFAAGLALAVVMTHQRKWLAGPWPYIAAAEAVLLFLPFIIWNIRHDFAHLEFMQNASAMKYGSQTAATFLIGQTYLPNPAALPLWLAGLVSVLLLPAGRRYAPVGIIFLTAAAILTLNGHSKAEYLASAYPMMMAAGAVLAEKMVRSRTALALYAGFIALVWLAVLPMSLPVLPVRTFICYQSALGLRPSTPEGKQLGDLPQFYADMFGWEDKARAVAGVYHSLTPAERKRCIVFSDNYGRAGAIDYYRKKYDLPPSICKHNSYWIWGPGPDDRDIVLILGGNKSDHARSFESVITADSVYTEYAIPYENGLHIYICRNSKIPRKEIWPRLKTFI